MVNFPDAICLDLDGTIVDTEASLSAGVAGAAAVAQRRLGVSAVDWATANSAAATEVWSVGARGWKNGVISPLRLSTDIYERTLELVGASPTLAPELVAVHGQSALRGLRAFDDVGPFLRSAVAAGIKLGLITNGASQTQRNSIEAMNLESTFDVVIISAEVGVSKPDHRIFEKAIDELGVLADRTWHIGDSYRDDVLGAELAGLQPVWLNRRREQSKDGAAPVGHLVDSLSELIPVLDG